MVELDALPDPANPEWGERVADAVAGTGVEPSLAKSLVRDAMLVDSGEITPEQTGGPYPLAAVRELGLEEVLDGHNSSDEHDSLAVEYDTAPTFKDEATDDSEASEQGSCGSGCDCTCGDAPQENGRTSVPVRKPEDYLPEGMTPEEATAEDVAVDMLDPEDLFPDIDSSSSIEPFDMDWDMDDVDGEWEDAAAADLADVDYDSTLGVEMSRDALAIAQGELTQAEFHEKYNDRVLEEFGVDHRPTRNAEPPEITEKRTQLSGTLPSVPGSDGVPSTSRRRFLKGAGAAASAGAVGSIAGCTDIAQQGTDPASYTGDVHMGMAIDTERCIGCLLCAEGCMEENNTDLGAFWMHVFRYEEDERGDVVENYMPRPCQHCSEPSCSYVCPTQARYKRDGDGIVLTNYETCIGCRYCQVACPYGVNYLGQEEGSHKSPGFWHPTNEREDGIEAAGPPSEGIMGKCTFCVHRQDETASRGTTACEDACPVDAIHFGDLEDPESDPRQHMRKKRETSRFELLENQGNEPNILYLGDEPSGKAEPTEGPYTYRDLDMKPLEEPATEADET